MRKILRYVITLENDVKKLYLEWNKFHDNIKTAFENFERVFHCHSGLWGWKTIWGSWNSHSILQSPLSDYSEKNQHPHPLIYMRGVKSKDLEAILDLFYCGEAIMFQESLDSFLSIAEELQTFFRSSCKIFTKHFSAEVKMHHMWSNYHVFGMKYNCLSPSKMGQSTILIWELSLWPHAMCMIIGFIDI